MRHLLFLLFFTFFPFTLHAAEKDFALEKTFTVNGDMALIGNVNIWKNTAGDPTDRNNEYNMVYVNSIGGAYYNASTARLDFNNSSYTVKWAGLYWQAQLYNGTAGTDINNSVFVDYNTSINTSNQIVFIDRNGTEHNITADTHYDDTEVDRYIYGSFADVTPLVTGEGNYTVANMKITQGQIDRWGALGGWALLVVYEDPNTNLPVKNVSVFNGFKLVETTAIQSIPITGFITPLSGAVDSAAAVFVLDGDNEGASNENEHFQMRIGTTATYTETNDTLNPVNNMLNSTISNKGVDNLERNPRFTDNLGYDLDIYDVSSFMENGQTETEIQVSTGGDLFTMALVAFSTQLYEPQFCYDYAYSQSGTYFTEENNGSYDPRMVGTVIPNDLNQSIETTFYLRNIEADIVAENVILTISDINTSQATLQTTTFQKTNPGQTLFNPALPISATLSDFNITLASLIGSSQGVYTKFFLDPKVTDLDFAFNGYFDYQYTLNSTTIKLPQKKLNEDIPLCAQGESVYTPEWGIFNIIDRNLNVTGYDDNTTPPIPGTLNANLKYNLYTQAAKRPFDVEIVSFDPINSSQVVSLNNFLGVELINAGGFHDINASCGDSSNAISERLWVPYLKDDANASDANITHTYFNVQEAIDSQVTDISTAEEFYADVASNVAFRMWYVVVDVNGTAAQFEYDASGNIGMINFPLSASGVTCHETVFWGVDSTTDADTVCDGTNYIAPDRMAACLECISGYVAKPICSRDNFSLRPEAFKIQISDINHSETNVAVQDATKELVPNVTQLAAGYNYRFDINATSHTSNEATPGFTLPFYEAQRADRNITFNWAPSISGLDCNDDNSSSPEFYMSNGSIVNQKRLHNNVGRYELSMIDTTYTEVDQNPAHHTGIYYNSGNDCLADDNSVPPLGTDTNNTNIGCVISSQHTNQDDSTLDTEGYTINFVPYKFTFQTPITLLPIVTSYGKNNTTLGSTANMYMSDLNKSLEMGIHYIGNIFAAGENNISLSNFTGNCYAQELNMMLDHNATEGNSTIPSFQSAYIDGNISHKTGAIDVNITTKIAQKLFTNYFTKANAGTIPNVELHFNYERNASDPKEIQTLRIGDLNVSCTSLANCNSYADLNANHSSTAYILANSNVNFKYARTHAPRYRIDGPTGTIPVYFEVYCKTLNCSDYNLTNESIDDINWYINNNHTDHLIQGTLMENNITTSAPTQELNFIANPAFVNTFGIKNFPVTYSELKSYPYKAKLLTTPDPWFIYNLHDDNITRNNFVVEFYNDNAAWSGSVDSNNTTVDSAASKTTNRRINW